ncbi:LolA family protein [Desulfurivibrio alkaliphilus]|uniref:Outer membrane lipoprotein carrier protein LolA n=1 Tax=Desulfurivibrio alkaliphilus (strain DSM 19089 / UNIQEM U267 / AHT2) TaxID=589865 RepID=D6Z6M9_DESAT|nr:outer membrane lipoprotein carrier protein LolA [Desulfurivibrio alkaliphilus]ADH84988.1 outer membrane lipoprotein carrier protein LolA [Desulfurivibrio alkaliphilus AHT 2]
MFCSAREMVFDRRRLLLPLLLILLLFADRSTVEAEADPDPEKLAGRLQEIYDQVTGFKAEFQQRTAMPMSRRQRAGEGTVMFRKPHQMRWEYAAPDHQVLVGDGKEVHFYSARSNQLMISEVDTYLDSDVTYAFFAGTGDILRDFAVTAVPERERPALPAGYHALRLEPRELHSQVEYLDLLVGGEPFFIRRLDIVDHFGSVTTLEFSRVELDPELPADFYRFEPPEEVEILRN